MFFFFFFLNQLPLIETSSRIFAVYSSKILPPMWKEHRIISMCGVCKKFSCINSIAIGGQLICWLYYIGAIIFQMRCKFCSIPLRYFFIGGPIACLPESDLKNIYIQYFRSITVRFLVACGLKCRRCLYFFVRFIICLIYDCDKIEGNKIEFIMVYCEIDFPF